MLLTKCVKSCQIIFAITLLFVFCTEIANAQTTAFNFQGRLNDGSSPANGRYDLQFKLFDSLLGGSKVGPTVEKPNAILINGVFSTPLDFGSTAFPGADRFIEISVRPAGSPNAFVILGGRQQVLAVPFAVNAATLGGNGPGDFIKNGTSTQNATFNVSGDGAVGGTLHAGQVRAQTGTFDPYGLVQTNGTVTVGTFVDNGFGGSLGTQSNHPLNFFTNNGTPQVTLTQPGNVGIGTTSPSARLHVQNTGLAGVAIRAVGGNLGGSAMIAMGNMRQNLAGNGLVKAMVYVNSDGSIARCYNGETNVSDGNCGFSITRNIGSWWIDLGFRVDDRFWTVTPGIGVTNIGVQANTVGANILAVKLFQTDVPGSTGENIFRNFMLVIY